MPNVCILLSTYNGEKYLRQQLDSLLAQTYPIETILVRDDGSSDSTLHILKEYADRHPVFHIIEGENTGVLRSFMTLLEMAPDDADYIAFCDQDDVWLEKKVERAIAHLEAMPSDQPSGYFCRLQVVDEELNLLYVAPRFTRPPMLGNALTECITTGCTLVFNQATRKKALQYLPGDYAGVYIHDWWLYLVITAFGSMIYDPEPCILYRQHENNAIGMSSRRVSGRLRRLREGKRYCTKQVEALYSTCGESLPTPQQKIISNYLSHQHRLIDRICYILAPDVYRQSWFDNIFLKILYLIKRV